MNAEEYGAMKQRLIAAVPRHAIIISLPKTLVIRATGGYLSFNHMEMDAELMDGMPQQTVDAFHNKLIVQYAPQADGDHWVNVGRTLAGEEQDLPEAAEKALAWLGLRLKFGELFDID